MKWKAPEITGQVSRSLSPSIYTSNIKYFIFNETFTLPFKALCKVASATIFLIVRRRSTMNDVRVIVTAAMMASRCVVLMAKSTKTSARWRCPPAGMAHGSSRCPSATAHRVSSATSLWIYSLHVLTKSSFITQLINNAKGPKLCKPVRFHYKTCFRKDLCRVILNQVLPFLDTFKWSHAHCIIRDTSFPSFSRG